MKTGNSVKNKVTGEYGTVQSALFGIISIYTYDEENQILYKTIGSPIEKVCEQWEVVKQIPDGYKVKRGGGLIKDIDNPSI